ncbi:hypothetical protein GCM10018966_075600 [Streptomyces yanii]
MSASWVVCSLRAAVFAAVCVLLAVAGHGLATGMAPPTWVDGAGFVFVFVLGCLLGSRECSQVGIGGTMLATQAGLHTVFGAASARSGMASHSMRAAHAPTRAVTHGHALAPPHVIASHATVAHVTAVLVAAWSLRRGEAAVWSLLRRIAAFVPGVAAWWQVRRGASGVRGEMVFDRRAADGPRPLRQALLRHAVHRRGPPKGIRTRTDPQPPLSVWRSIH